MSDRALGRRRRRRGFETHRMMEGRSHEGEIDEDEKAITAAVKGLLHSIAKLEQRQTK